MPARPLLTRVSVAVAVLVLGAATGIAGIVLHLYLWGLLLTVAATVLTAYALPPGAWTRVPFGVGFAAAVALGTTPRPEGDYLVAATLNGYLLLALTVGVFVGGFLTSLPRRRPPVIAPPTMTPTMTPTPEAAP